MRKTAIRMGIVLLLGLSLFAAGCTTSGSSESEYKYKETKELVSLVKDAVGLINSRGEAAFAELAKPGSKWSRDNTYVFVFDMKANFQVHPDPELKSNNQLDLKDVQGKPIIKNFIGKATGYKGKDEGWSHYLWPEPGSIFPIWKSAFVKLAKAPSGNQYIVGCGLYSMKMEKPFVVDAVLNAATLIEEKGTAAFDVLRDPGSEFFYKDTYVLVVDQNGIMVVHPIFRNLEDKKVLDDKDAKGKYLFREMLDIAKNKDSGWDEYMWPKPGESTPKPKMTFVKKATSGDKWYVVGSGVYLED